jgi:hypothetical protein
MANLQSCRLKVRAVKTGRLKRRSGGDERAQI